MHDVDIAVEIENIPAEKNSPPARGSAHYINSWNRDGPRQFLIKMNGIRQFRYFMMTLSHELIHVEQFLKGKLEESEDGKRHLLERQATQRLRFGKEPGLFHDGR